MTFMTSTKKVFLSLALAAAVIAAPATLSADEGKPRAGATEVGGALPAKLADKYSLTGEKETCFQVTRIRQSRPVDDFHLLFKLTNGDEYLSRLSNRCAGLRMEGAYSYSTGLNKLCHLEIITVLSTSTGTRRGSCGLGVFEKIEKK